MNKSKLSINIFHAYTDGCGGNPLPIRNRNFPVLFLLSLLLLLTAASVSAQTIGNHSAVYDPHGILLP